MMSYVFVCRTDDLACIKDFFKTMCTPSRNTRNGENRSKQLFWDSKHSIYETAVKVYVCTDIFEKSALLHNKSSTQTFYQFIQCKFFHHALFLSKFSGKSLEDHFTWIGKCINCMSHTIDQTGMVKCLFIKDLTEIIFHFFLIGPVFYVCLDVLEHILHFQVCTTMTRSLQRTDGCCNRRIRIGAG